MNKLEEKITQNIWLLQLTIQKNENSTAKVALAKNIARAQEELEKEIYKKLAKLNELQSV
jgi:hypothetical protein